jgi:3-hydroxybutyryl-CoA dehydrogenase
MASPPKHMRGVAVIGAGFMGCVIATLYAAKGWRVSLYDDSRRTLDSFPERALPTAATLATAQDSAHDIVKRVELAPTLVHALTGAEVVQETIHEDLAAKQVLFAELDRLCPPDVLLASNTSSFMLSQVARDVHVAQRVVGIHFVTPAHVVPVVEVITTARNTPEHIERAREIVSSLDHVPIVCRESPGFLVNRIQLAMLAEIHRIVDERLASPEDVDAAVKLALGPRWALWGALECEDLIVNKTTALAAMRYMHEQTGQAQYRPTASLERLIGQERLGAAAGAGWYDWPEPYDDLAVRRDRQLTAILKWLSAAESIR